MARNDGCMTETPESRSEPIAAAEPPSRGDRQWDKPHRRSGVFRLAAFFVMLAAVVFIIAVIFWSGFILGAHGGGHHGGEGGGSRQERGMMHHGVPMERSVPSVSTFAG
jgi:hypothetical protein